MAAGPVIPITIMYALGLGASVIEYGPERVPLFLVVALAATVVSRVVKEHRWQRARSRAGRSTTGSR